MLGLGNTLSGGIVPAAAVASFADDYSLDFDGANDHVLTDLEFVNRNVTMSCWVKQDTAAYLEGILGDMTAARANTMWLNTWFSGGLWIRIGDGSATYSAVITSVNIADGNWHHVVFQIQGDDPSDNGIDPKVWVDGTLVLDVTGYTSNKDSTTVEFGMGENGGSLLGNINDVAVWQKQLSTAEVVKIYNSGTPTDLTVNDGDYESADDLIGYWKMGDGDTYPTITDHGGSNNGTMTNMTSGDIVADTP